MLTAAVTALLVVAPVSAATGATTPTPEPTPSTTGSVTFTLSPVAGGVASPDTGVTAIVAVQNDTAATLPAASVRLLLGATAFASRAEAASWAAAPDDRDLQEVGAITLDPVAPGERRTWSFVVSASDPALAARTPGVYPLLAGYGDGATSYRSGSSIVVAVPSTLAAPVGVVVPITAPPRTAGLLTADELAAATAVDGTLTQQLDGVDGTGAILAVDPAVVVAIRILGDSAPETATAWLARLLALPNSRFALQFGDADVAAQLHSDVGMLLQPEAFDAQLDPALFATETGDDTAAPTPGAVREPVLPTLEDLLDIGDVPAGRLYWPATGTADAEVVDMLRADATTAATLVASADTSASAGTAPARGDGVLVYDSALSAALRDASLQADGVVRGAALARVAAQLAFALPEAAGTPLLVTLDRGEGRSRVALRAAVSAIADSDGVALDDLGDLLAATPATAVVTGGTPDTARADAVDALVGDEASVDDFATIVDDPRVLTAPQRASTLQTLSVGWVGDDAAWQAALAQQRATTAATLAAVNLPPPTDVNLLTANTRLQFVVRNGLPWPVTVTLVAEPDDPRLRVQRTTQVQAGALSDTRVIVPVESRVGSGDVTVDLQLQSPTGVAIGAADSVDVRVRAEWEGIGVVVLSVLVGGLLVLGIVRTVLRRRATRATRTASDAPTDGDDA